MAFSEAELVFLALIFIFALGFLMSSLGARDNTSTVKKTKKKRKERKRVTRRHCQEQQSRSRRGPDENDDEEPYNPRGTILWWDFLMLLLLIHYAFLEVMTIYIVSSLLPCWYQQLRTPWDLLITAKFIFELFFRKLWELVNNRKKRKDDVLRLLNTLAGKALLLRNISTFYSSRIMWREIKGHVAVYERLLATKTEDITQEFIISWAEVNAFSLTVTPAKDSDVLRKVGLAFFNFTCLQSVLSVYSDSLVMQYVC